MLLAKGADPNQTNDRGQAIIAGAVFKGVEEIVRLLLDAQADPLLGHPTAVDTARIFKKDNILVMLEPSPPDGALLSPLPTMQSPKVSESIGR